jgi:glycosyltransferase involved in cell wall biosynthesis
LVPELCDALVALGVDNYLLTAGVSAETGLARFPLERERVCTFRVPRSLAGRLGFGGQIRLLLDRQVGDSEDCLIHDHGVWLGTNHVIAAYCRRNGLKRVVSPHGMLTPWAMKHSKFKKLLAWHLYQLRDLRAADGFYVTNKQEADDLRRLGLDQPVLIAPYGMEFPEKLPERTSLPHKQALFLSRIHPKKGLLTLVRAWAKASIPQDWRLVIAGPDECGHRKQVEKEVEALDLSRKVDFVGVVDGDAKWRLLCNSHIFLLPSYSENFGIAVAEAMAAGLPVVTTTTTPWEIVKTQKLGWWIEPNEDALTETLTHALNLSSEELTAMGKRAGRAARAMCTWKDIASRLMCFYASLRD